MRDFRRRRRGFLGSHAMHTGAMERRLDEPANFTGLEGGRTIIGCSRFERIEPVRKLRFAGDNHKRHRGPLFPDPLKKTHIPAAVAVGKNNIRIRQVFDRRIYGFSLNFVLVLQGPAEFGRCGLFNADQSYFCHNFPRSLNNWISAQRET